MRVERIPTLSDNYTYLIIDEDSLEAAIIDAPEADPVIARVEELGVNVTKVLSTHHHYDHSAANPELAKRYGAPVLGHMSDAERIPGFVEGLEEGDTIRVGSLEAEIVFIPAHTSGHIAYVFPGAVFSGDTLFAGGCGRLFEGNPQMMHEALNEKLSRLPDDTKIYCGHEYTESNLRFALSLEPGNQALVEKMNQVKARRAKAAADWHDATDEEMTIPSTIAEERATNPFMRIDSAELVASVKKAAPQTGDDPVSILRAVRSLKDTFWSGGRPRAFALRRPAALRPALLGRASRELLPEPAAARRSRVRARTGLRHGPAPASAARRGSLGDGIGLRAADARRGA